MTPRRQHLFALLILASLALACGSPPPATESVAEAGTKAGETSHDSIPCTAVLAELLEHEEAFAGGNWSRLLSTQRSHESWNEDGRGDELLNAFRAHPFRRPTGELSTP